MIGQTLSHCRILSKLGEGGMGEVYRAHDETLDRDVAIKVLPEEVASDPGRLARFEREAKVVAKLSHPNILAVYELGSHEGVPYIVTELLEGESLREVIESRRLTSRRAIEYASQIANGLAAAHARDIVHRDLKPGNVFVTVDGVVKILDFGLAKLKQPDAEGEPATQARTLTKETDPGKVMGTVGYMSPEQVRAEAIDHRSDIFSLGVVMYEMLTGERPFRAASSAEIMSAIVQENPARLSQLEPAIQPPLERVVSRCLEKRPADRFQSARDLAFDLQGILTDSDAPSAMAGVMAPRSRRVALWAAAAAVATLAVIVGLVWRERAAAPGDAEVVLDENLVVILPFQNLTGDASMDVHGLTAASLIADGLARAGEHQTLLVDWPGSASGGDSARPLLQQPQALAELARTHGAATVVSGTLAPSGEDIQLQARVLDGATGQLVRTEGPLLSRPEDLDESVSEFSRRVMAAVSWHLSSDKHLVAMAEPPIWEAYLEFKAGAEPGIRNSEIVEYMERALEIDPDFVGARFKLSGALVNQGRYVDAMALVEGIGAESSSLSPFGREFLAYRRNFFTGNWLRGLRHARRMQELEQGYDGRLDIAIYARRANRPLETLEALNERHGESAESVFGLAAFDRRMSALHGLGRHEEELEVTRRCSEVFPDEVYCRGEEARALSALGLVDELSDLLERCAASAPVEESIAWIGGEGEDAGYVMEIAVGELRAHGRPDAAREVADRLVRWCRARLDEAAPTPDQLHDLAYALYLDGELDEAAAIYERLAGCEVERINSVDDFRCLYVKTGLGILAARRGDHSEAMRISQELAKVDDTPFGGFAAGRAVIAAHLGERDEALDLLREALASGLLAHLAHQDVDFEPLWDDPEFQELIAPKG